MAVAFEILGPDDKPALLALSTPEFTHAAQTALDELGYKVHRVETHDEFDARFTQVQYHLLITEEAFAGPSRAENRSLERFQMMPMNQRRHTASILIGDSFASMDRMSAWKESVNGLVNRADIGSLKEVIQQVASEHSLFYQTFRDVQAQLAKGR